MRKLFKKHREQPKQVCSVYDSTEVYDQYVKWRQRTREAIDHFPYESKCKLFYDIVNSFDLEWPNLKWPNNALTDTIKPEYWEELSEELQKEYVIHLKECIELSVGSKGLERYYYQTICGYSDQQFEDWWESKF